MSGPRMNGFTYWHEVASRVHKLRMTLEFVSITVCCFYDSQKATLKSTAHLHRMGPMVLIFKSRYTIR